MSITCSCSTHPSALCALCCRAQMASYTMSWMLSGLCTRSSPGLCGVGKCCSILLYRAFRRRRRRRRRVQRLPKPGAPRCAPRIPGGVAAAQCPSGRRPEQWAASSWKFSTGTRREGVTVGSRQIGIMEAAAVVVMTHAQHNTEISSGLQASLLLLSEPVSWAHLLRSAKPSLFEAEPR